MPPKSDPGNSPGLSPGLVVDGRYQPLEAIGSGSSAQVWLCWDSETRSLVAIKCFEIWDGMLLQSSREIDIQMHLDRQPMRSGAVSRLIRSFDLGERKCLVFEYIKGYTLRDSLNFYGKKGLPLQTIVEYSRQLLEILDFLATPVVNTLHGDLKPENAMLTGKMERLMLLDFGLSFKVDEVKHGLYIQSRWYRAPEVLMGLCPSVAVDMWSFGCILAELISGRPPFTGENSLDQLRQECEAVGLPTDRMLQKASASTVTVVEKLKTDVQLTWQKAGLNARLTTREHFENLILGNRQVHPSLTRQDQEELLDLAWGCLAIDPENRATPTQARNHPVLQVPDVSPIHACSPDTVVMPEYLRRPKPLVP